MIDVLVIGGGLAGVSAALAAQAEGARVAVAQRAWGATAMSHGALDIAYQPALEARVGQPPSLAEHLGDIAQHRSRHPFAVMGPASSLQGVQAGFARLAEALGGLATLPLAWGPLDMAAPNRPFLSTLGVVLTAGAAAVGHLGHNLRPAGRWGLCTSSHTGYADARSLMGALRQFDPELAEHVVPLSVAAVPGGPAQVAQALEAADGRALAAMADELQPLCRGLEGLWMPPYLGLGHHGRVRQTLSERLGVQVVEMLAHMPSVPGARLQLALDALVLQRRMVSVGEVMALQAGSAAAGPVVTCRDGQRLTPGAVVLATGRFIAGGITGGERCRETLLQLGCISDIGRLQDEDPQAMVRQNPVESHPLMTAGIRVSQDMQVLTDERVPLPRLFAAGMVIGGFASRFCRCADGIALATGERAGGAAARAAGGLAP